jgi:hypothetical protein
MSRGRADRWPRDPSQNASDEHGAVQFSKFRWLATRYERRADIQLKALLRKAAERTVEGLWTTISRLVEVFTPSECTNYFAAAGYDAA